MKTMRIALGFGVLAVVVCSCIRFERQALSLRYDPDVDAMLIFQVYEGIYADSGAEAPNENERNQLQSLFDGDRTFFFSNWIFEYNEANLQEMVDEYRELTAKLRTRQSLTQEEREKVEDIEWAIPMVIAALDNVRVRNGEFYLNDAGELCGYQKVTISNVSGLVRAANRAISVKVRGAYEERGDDLTAAAAEWWERLKKAAEHNYVWIRVDENRVMVRVPMDYKMYREMKGDFLAEHRRVLTSDAAGLPAVRRQLTPLIEWLMGDFQYGYHDGAAQFELGHPAAKTVTLATTVDPSNKSNLVDYVRENYGIEDVDVAAVREEFLSAE